MTGLRGGGSLPASNGGTSQPSRTASASQRIHKEWAATRVWRYNFRHHVITIRDQYGFATS
ncbi:MAG: hypothetical protein WB689_00790, partial [Xanthobacteraceae bacterium]